MNTKTDVREIIENAIKAVQGDYENVEIFRSGVSIIFRVRSEDELVDARSAKGACGMKIGSARKLYHAKRHGSRTWYTYNGSDALAPIDGYAVGIQVETTKQEDKDQILGRWAS